MNDQGDNGDLEYVVMQYVTQISMPVPDALGKTGSIDSVRRLSLEPHRLWN